MSKTARPKRLYAYVGVRPASETKLVHIYAMVDADWESKPPPPPAITDDTHAFSKPIGRWVRPGQVVEAEYAADDPGRVFINSGTVVGSYPKDVCVEWQTLHNTHSAACNAAKQAKKDGQRDLALERLEPFRLAYDRLRTREERSILLARIMDYIARNAR